MNDYELPDVNTDMTDEEIEGLLEIGCCIYHYKIGEKAHNYIKKQQTRIDKAIEYIEKCNNNYCNLDYLYPLSIIDNNKELLQILKGENIEFGSAIFYKKKESFFKKILIKLKLAKPNKYKLLGEITDFEFKENKEDNNE